MDEDFHRLGNTPDVIYANIRGDGTAMVPLVGSLKPDDQHDRAVRGSSSCFHGVKHLSDTCR